MGSVAKKFYNGAFYRPEIDGLRAIAIISVILYHAKFTIFGKELFKGGFIGVDIFFVISGYLISRIVLLELYEKSSFNFLNFYVRRSRRILPLLLFVILVATAFAWLVFLPSDLIKYSESIVSSIFFGSNFLFYFNSLEYAADSALLSPLLHTWSLGVEEQFYLILPIVCVFLFRFNRNGQLPVVIAACFLLSLQLSEIMSTKNASFNFYMPLGRFWEFFIGSLIAYRELNKTDDRKVFGEQFFPILGLYLIVYSILFFNVSTPHPSFHTLVPVIGTALIIGFPSKNDLVVKALSCRAFVFLGLISYSLYLWHFPIFSFFRYTDLDPSNYSKLYWLLLTIVSSVVSFYLIERPFRNPVTVHSKIFWSVVLFFVIMCLTVAFLISNKVIYNASKVEMSALLDKGRYISEHDDFEIFRDYTVKADSRKSILFVGNSHAEDLFKVLSYTELNKIYRLNLLSPLVRSVDINYQIECFYAYLYNGTTVCNGSDYSSNINLQYSDADIVVLSSRWLGYIGKENLTSLSFVIQEVVKKLLLDNKKVIIVSNSPESKVFGDRKLNRLDKFLFEKKRLPTEDELSDLERLFYKDYINGESGLINKEIRDLVERFDSEYVQYADRSDFMCDSIIKKCFLYFKESLAKTLWDYSHVTTDGAKELAKIVDVNGWLLRQIEK